MRASLAAAAVCAVAVAGPVWPTRWGSTTSSSIGSVNGPGGHNLTVANQFYWGNLSSPASSVIDDEGSIYVVSGVQPASTPGELLPLLYKFGPTGNLIYSTANQVINTTNPYFVFNIVAGSDYLYTGTALPDTSATIIAINGNDGSIAWHVDSTGVEVAAFSMSPDEKSIYIQYGNATLCVVDAHTGASKAVVPMYLPARGVVAQRAWMTLSPSGDMLFLASPRSVVAVRTADYSVAWNVTDVVNLQLQQPVLITADGKTAIIVDRASVSARNAATGAQLWSSTYPRGVPIDISAAALHPAGYVILGVQPSHFVGSLCVYSVAEGTRVSCLATPANIGIGEHVVVDKDGGYIYYTSYDADLLYVNNAAFSNDGVITPLFAQGIFTDYAPSAMSVGPTPGKLTFSSFLELTIYA